MACALALAVVWHVVAPRTADLAAQVYRTQLFAREGFAVWDNNWFGGHHLPGYSLLFPALAASLGPSVVGMASVIASTGLFAALVGDRSPGRKLAIGWFACAATGDLFIGRLTFALGVTCAMACLLAVARRRPALAVAIGLLTAAASPVSALLLTLVLVAWWPPLGHRWRFAVLAAPIGLAGALSLVFPEGGAQPYGIASALAALAIVAGVRAVLPVTMREARRGTVLYGLAIALAYALPTPMGSNVARLGVLAGGPLLALAAGAAGGPARSRRAVLVGTAVAVLCWQLWAPVTEGLKAHDSQATTRAYFQPLTTELARLPPGRVEVVPTSTRWESVYVAGHVALARGWETQLDRRYNGLFYNDSLRPQAYGRWLRHLGVAYVAVSDGPKERWGRLEARLLAQPPGFLRQVWHRGHWRLLAVSGTPPIVAGGRLLALRPESVTVAATHAGPLAVRVRYTRFWDAGSGVCITRTPSGFTRLVVPAAGTYTLRASFAVSGLLQGSQPTCASPAVAVPSTPGTTAASDPARTANARRALSAHPRTLNP
jgi:hypothetical protein